MFLKFPFEYAEIKNLGKRGRNDPLNQRRKCIVTYSGGNQPRFIFSIFPLHVEPASTNPNL